MKKSALILVAVLVLAAAAAGYFIGQSGKSASGTDSANADGANSGQREVLYWKAPMDPDFRRDQPGKSPMGMDLVPVYADGGEDGDSSDVRIDPAVVNNLGVRTAAVERGSLSGGIEAVGYVGYDEDSLVSINTRAEGWVENLAVKSAGEPVRKGQRLYSLFSPKLATAEREYLTALKSGSESLIAASRQRMRALGFSAAQIARLKRSGKIGERVARYADSAGVVVALGVREGAFVQPATQVMQLADLSSVWILVELDPADVARVHKGQQAVVTVDAFAGERFKGMVDYIYPDVDATTRTVKVRLRLPNPDRRLQPNMYAHVRLATGAGPQALIIPAEALIETGSSRRVIVARGEGRFDVCPVKTGRRSGRQVEILAGLEAGQRVVTSAQFMLDSEANVDAAALRLDGANPKCGKPAGGHEHSMDHGAMPGMDMSHAPADEPAPAPAASAAAAHAHHAHGDGS